jgi:hypothetical protein
MVGGQVLLMTDVPRVKAQAEANACSVLSRSGCLAGQVLALGVLAIRNTPRGPPRPRARAARSPDGRRGATRTLRVVPMVSVRRWAGWCAAPLRRGVAPWRRSVRLSARSCAT